MRGAWRLGIDPTKCAGRGLCAELLPELIQLDDWGFPLIADVPLHGDLARHAKRAVAACPELALFLDHIPGPTPTRPSARVAPAAPDPGTGHGPATTG
jgi:ferredoxin